MKLTYLGGVFSLFLFQQPRTPALRLDFSEADQAVKILGKEKENIPVLDSDWNSLFSSVPYEKLKQQEASFHNAFSNDDFRHFLQSSQEIAKTDSLVETLKAWKKTDFNKIAERVKGYLPQGAVLCATVFPLIKLSKNSFVWGDAPEKAIFLYVNPSLSQQQFANKVAHESHHIGMSSLEGAQNKLVAGLSDEKRAAFEWLGGFGEGEAMLAAAGSPTIHPHFHDAAAAKAVWDKALLHFNGDIVSLQVFYTAILDGKLKGDDQIQQAAGPFWGTQGPWYTAGYKMCQLIEVHFGRTTLMEAYMDPRKMLVFYNQAARLENNRHHIQLALWSAAFITRLY